MVNIIKYSSIRIIFPPIKVFKNLVAFFNLGLLYFNAAKLNNKDSLNNLGDIYTNCQGIEQNYTKAIEYYVKSEKLNNMYAINNLKVLYANGKGVEQDYTKAIEYFERAGKLGNSNSLYNKRHCVKQKNILTNQQNFVTR